MTSPDMDLAGSYDFLLVALSVLIAILASYAALDLAGRVTSARDKARLLWLSGGAVAMGIGIWSMHYIGMLAFRLPVPVQYDWPTVLLSLLAAILASAVALFVVSRHQMGVLRASLGQHLNGRRYRRHALHRHGGDAVVRHVPLFSFALHTFDRSRNCDFFRGFMADLLFPDREEGLELA